MLFHSSIRKELTRSFSAIIVMLVTIVMTMTLIRTLGEASRGVFDPADVMVLMVYIVLSDLPTILAVCLFIAILSVLTRMFRDSEMVIWFGSGKGLASLLKPIFQWAWPILFTIAALAFFILPWAFGQIAELRDKFERRSDIARIEPGRFQESANGDRVFFIEKNDGEQTRGRNVFIATREAGKETITSAQTGEVQIIGNDKFLVLKNGQRLEKNLAKDELALSVFESYSVRVGAAPSGPQQAVASNAMGTWALLQTPNPEYRAELSWRLGLLLAAINFVVIGVAAAGVNPRVGKAGNLGLAFFTFIVYFNLLLLGKNWINNGQVHIGVFLLALHGGAWLAGSLWLAKRHNNWTMRLLRR